ncbi:hypothetical protein VTL71DRAFT_8087 [Oculimacula yallundae]|uniref:Protein-lysine N-methyltransferase EFM4 n=1 Tax=Oculimacula yallundae TaxID=86028 RepID=A0ABR4CWL0_9HELO
MASTPSSKPNHLEPSQLGTKEYWDDLYVAEISNHALDPTDEGTIWFDDSGAEDKVLSFLEQKIAEEHILSEGITKLNCSFLDLGTGNGHFLFALREGEEDDDEDDEDEEAEGEGGEAEKGRGWGGRMLGVDYSERSVQFAKRIAAEKGYAEEQVIEFLNWDIMTESPSSLLASPNEQGWDVVLDKGTFDAISLSEEKDQRGRRICEGYRERVLPLVRKGGVFLVTSCNWTEEELVGWFADREGEGEGEGEGGFEVLDRIEYRSFQFGGRKGQSRIVIVGARLSGSQRGTKLALALVDLGSLMSQVSGIGFGPTLESNEILL